MNPAALFVSRAAITPGWPHAGPTRFMVGHNGSQIAHPCNKPMQNRIVDS
jgi:hypothetical protein